MRERALAYTFLILGCISMVMLAVVLIAAWPTVVIASNLFVWALMWLIIALVVSGSIFLIGAGSHKWQMAGLERQEKQQAIHHAAQRLQLEQHVTLTRVPADMLGNYPIHLPREPLPYAPLTFAPGNSPHAPRIQRGTEVEPIMPAIAAPLRVPTFAEMVQSGLIAPFEQESILGFSDGEPRRGPWDKLYSFMALGISGSGKSSTIAYYTALAVMHGARLLAIDPEAEMDDSLTMRLAGLEPFFLASIATTPQAATRILDIADRELARPQPYPVLWITDEFSSIMRAGERKLKGWGELADRIAGTTEDWAQRGRKRKRTTIAIGQIGNATRTGGTEVRASMTATFVHRVPVQQARLVLDNTQAKECPRLATGEVMVLLNTSAEPYRMQIPYTQPRDMGLVVEAMEDAGSGFPPLPIRDYGTREDSPFSPASALGSQGHRANTEALVDATNPLGKPPEDNGKSYRFAEDERTVVIELYRALGNIDKVLRQMGKSARYHKDASRIIGEEGL